MSATRRPSDVLNSLLFSISRREELEKQLEQVGRDIEQDSVDLLPHVPDGADLKFQMSAPGRSYGQVLFSVYRVGDKVRASVEPFNSPYDLDPPTPAVAAPTSRGSVKTGDDELEEAAATFSIDGRQPEPAPVLGEVIDPSFEEVSTEPAGALEPAVASIDGETA